MNGFLTAALLAIVLIGVTLYAGMALGQGSCPKPLFPPNAGLAYGV